MRRHEIFGDVAVAPPQSRIGPLTRLSAGLDSAVAITWAHDKPIDRESAYELLTAQAERRPLRNRPSRVNEALWLRLNRGDGGIAGCGG